MNGDVRMPLRIPFRYRWRWFWRGFFFQPFDAAKLRREIDELVALNREKP